MLILNLVYEKHKKKILVFAGLLSCFFGLTGCETPYQTTFGFEYSNPSWAPPYVAGVRYYYLPDIEVYYDLSDQQYIYLDNARWMFSSSLPSFYSSYDLYNGFVVSLNTSVYQPWLHHQFYVSHYPRYYYHNYYKNRDLNNIRGFNENLRKPVYRPGDRKRNIDIKPPENKPEMEKEIPRMPQPTNYYGRNIGIPVRVSTIMKERAQKKKSGGRP